MWNQFSYFTVLDKVTFFKYLPSQSGEEKKMLQGLKIQNKNIIYINNDVCAQLKTYLHILSHLR